MEISSLFKKYPSLINVEHKKDIQWWLDNHPELKDEIFVIREKIDGANFQILFMPDGSMKFGRRTEWLVEDEKFYDYISAVDKIRHLLEVIKDRASDQGLPQRAYFELYGPGINRRVKYGNDGLKLCILDIATVGYAGFDQLWTQLELEDFISNAFDPHEYMAPFLGIHKYEDALSFDPNFNSRILNIEENQTEGVVIQPYKNNYINHRGERFIIKSKNEDFGEVVRQPRIYKPSEYTEEQKIFMSYINDNRILSVFSKHGPLPSVHKMGDYIRLVFEDAKEDFIKENPQIDTYDRALFSPAGKLIVPLLKKHL